MSEGTIANRRPIRGLINNLKSQMKYSLINVSFSLAVAVILNSFWLYRYREIGSICSNLGGEINLAVLNESVTTGVFGSVVALFVIAFFTFGYTIILTHRFMGPLQALEKKIDLMLAGDYSVKFNVRKDDEVKTLAEKLNQVNELLKSKDKK